MEEEGRGRGGKRMEEEEEGRGGKRREEEEEGRGRGWKRRSKGVSPPHRITS
jgi:hypothetical protein